MKDNSLRLSALVCDMYKMGKRVVRTARGVYKGVSVLSKYYADRIVEFFMENTHIFSGQTNETRNLLIPHHVLLCRLDAETPEMLRDLAKRVPALVVEARRALDAGESLNQTPHGLAHRVARRFSAAV